MGTDTETSIGTGRMPTGITGFDEIADGGLPRSGITVVLGSAGSGKTTFGMQVLAAGARKHGEPGILVAFEESPGRVLANTAGFDWGGVVLNREGVHLIDAQLSQAVEHGGEFDLIGLLAILDSRAKSIGARRIVFDGLDVLLGYLGNDAAIRREAYRLRDWVYQSGLTALVTAKADDAGQSLSNYFDFLQFMADCVVTLHHRLLHGTALRFVRIAKYRGAPHSSNEFPLAINQAGLEVATDALIFRTHAVTTERISTGVQRLDAMLAGGYYRGSSVLLTGVPGTAKTSLAAAFAQAAASRGERTLFLSFDEAPEQIVRNLATMSIQLAPHLDAGTLVLRSLRARAQSPEAHVAQIRSLIREVQPLNLVIDPLSALAHSGLEPIAEGAALQVLDLAKSAGITVVFTSLLGTSTPLIEQTPINISSIADTWIHMSNVDQGGERNRSLSIVKSRGTNHSKHVRELLLSHEGITLADVYSAGGEVLMGTLRWEKENEERRKRANAQNDAMLREQRVALALAETKANLANLAQAQVIQEEELLQLKARNDAELDSLADEEKQLQKLRLADHGPKAFPTSADAREGLGDGQR